MRSGRCGGGAAVGETQEEPCQLSFNGQLKIDFQGSRVTSDGGLLLVRELDERLGFGALVPDQRSVAGRPGSLCELEQESQNGNSGLFQRSATHYFSCVTFTLR